MTKSNIEKVRDYGENFGENIKEYCPNWETDLGKYKCLHALYNRTDLKDDEKENIRCKILKLRNLYSLQRSFKNRAIPEAVKYMCPNKEMLYKEMKLGDEKIVGEIALNMGHKSMGFKRQMCFATKFCFFNNETAYPICDSYAFGSIRVP